MKKLARSWTLISFDKRFINIYRKSASTIKQTTKWALWSLNWISHSLSDFPHLARDSLDPVKNSPGGSIIVRRTFFFDILDAFPSKPFEDPSGFWSQHISWMDSTQDLLCCQKFGLSSQSLEVVSVNKMYMGWHALSYKGRFHEENFCSFGFCPNYLSPPFPPIWSTCTTFFRRQNSRFESQFRTKSTIYTI